MGFRSATTRMRDLWNRRQGRRPTPRRDQRRQQLLASERLETRAMACPWSVVLNPGPPRQVMIASDALDLVHEVESQLSVYRDDSRLSRLNANAADAPQTVDPGLFELLKRCQDLAVETEGAFDPVTRSLILLWRRCREAGTVPETIPVTGG